MEGGCGIVASDDWKMDGCDGIRKSVKNCRGNGETVVDRIVSVVVVLVSGSIGTGKNGMNGRPCGSGVFTASVEAVAVSVDVVNSTS